MGFPVIFGYLNGDVIDEVVTGLTIPSVPMDGRCPADATSLQTTPTAFGYDTITGCALSLTRDQLREFCCTGAPGSCLANSYVSTLASTTPFSDPTSGIPFFLNVSTDGYVGIYGDADPLDVTQWFSLAYSKPTDSRTWNDETSTCSNVFSGKSIL